jgi:hypothetical protein
MVAISRFFQTYFVLFVVSQGAYFGALLHPTFIGSAPSLKLESSFIQFVMIRWKLAQIEYLQLGRSNRC